jgi:hypothetical protein
MKENDIRDGIDQLFSALKEMADDKKGKTFELIQDNELVKMAVSCVEQCDPEAFNDTFGLDTDNMIEAIIHSVCDNPYFVFLFTKYQFIDSHIEVAIRRKEGMACCADKTRTITRMLAKWAMTGDDMDFTHDESISYCYTKKVFTTQDEIVKFFEALGALYNGWPEKYLSCLQNILVDGEES